MGLAFVRLTTILLAVLFSLFLAIMGLRKLSSNQDYADFAHPLKQQKFWSISFAAEPKEGSIPAAEVQQLSDQSLVVSTQHFLQKNGEVIFLNRLTLMQWKEHEPNGQTLEAFLEKSAQGPVFLEVNHAQMLTASTLRDLIRKYKAGKDVLIQTSSQRLKQSLKKIEPEWLYGATTAESSKFRLTTSLYLEGLTVSAFDFLILEEFTERQLQELKKRHIRSLLRFTRPSDLERIGAPSIDGVILAGEKKIL